MICDTNDSVAVVIESVNYGDDVSYIIEGVSKKIKALHNITIYHKVAVKDVEKGASVIKYGESIGNAIQDIKVGEHVHTFNLESARNG
jgi:altronate dehydratase small subunit